MFTLCGFQRFFIWTFIHWLSFICWLPIDMFYGGLGMFLVLFLRWLFLDKIDAVLLPLHIKESHDR